MSSGDNDNWCTIESDPGVFTELLEAVGVKGVELQEIWMLDDDTLSQLDPFYGLIFLFKWMPGQEEEEEAKESTNNDDNNDDGKKRQPLSDIPPGLFFARQTVQNACATQALLSILLNTRGLELGPILSEFRNFTSTFPPDLKGEAIGASVELQRAHNSFARKDAFLQEGDKQRVATGTEDVFHFVAYIPHEGTVYELDGLQTGPIPVGTYGTTSSDDNADTTTSDPWYGPAREAIQQRMQACSEIKFNLMAMVGDPRLSIRKRLEKEEDSPELNAQLALQEAKRQQWKLENQRRRHNYVPLCIQILKELARKGDLPQLVSEAKERASAKRLKKQKEEKTGSS